MRRFYSLFYVMIVCFCLLMINSFSVEASAKSVDDVKSGNAYIAEDTVMKLKVLDSLDSNVNKKYDLVNAVLVEDLVVDNVVIIPKDTQFKGMITKIHGSRMFGESAVIHITLPDYKMANGKMLHFKDDLKLKGGKNYTGLAASVVVPFSGLLLKGKEVNCPAGAVVDYEFKENIDLGIPKSAVASLQAEPVK